MNSPYSIIQIPFFFQYNTKGKKKKKKKKFGARAVLPRLKKRLDDKEIEDKKRRAGGE